MKSVSIVSIGYLTDQATASQVVMCAFVKYYLSIGWNVDYFCLRTKQFALHSYKEYDFLELSERLNIYDIECNEIDLLTLSKRISSIYRLEYKLNPHINESVRNVVDSNFYDVSIFFESVAFSLHEIFKSHKKIFIPADPACQRLFSSSAFFDLKLKLISLVVFFAESFYLRSFRNIATISMFGRRHAQELSFLLQKNVLCLRPVLPIENFDNTPRLLSAETCIVFYFGGSLTGTASKSTIKFINNTILPSLEAFQKHQKAEVLFRIIGSSSSLFKSSLKSSPILKLVGWVQSFENEIAKGHVFIMISNYHVGVRTRIAAALASGCACIVHPSIYVNMPELRLCKSVFTARNKCQLTQLLLEKFSSFNREYYQTESILFYQKYFSYQTLSFLADLT